MAEMEKIYYIYKCPKCGHFKELSHRDDGMICKCGGHMVMAKPEEVVKKYKASRFMYQFLTILFTIILPIATLSAFMFSAPEQTVETSKTLCFKLPVLFLILAGSILLKGRKKIEEFAYNQPNIVARGVVLFFSKNALYFIVLGLLITILVYIGYISDYLQQEFIKTALTYLNQFQESIRLICAAIATVLTENTIGYCIFDYRASVCDYYIKRSIRQSETMQAIEMSGESNG